MKKYFLFTLTLILIVPSIAFASWWNPFSWFNSWSFDKKVSTEVVQPKLPSIVDTKTTTIPTAEVKKDIPKIDNSIVPKKETQAKLDLEQKAKDEQKVFMDKQKADEQAKIDAEQKATYLANQEADLKRKKEEDQKAADLAEQKAAYLAEQESIRQAELEQNQREQAAFIQQQAAKAKYAKDAFCANYQIEKNNLDNSSARNGTLFSGARVSAENALKVKYASCF